MGMTKTPSDPATPHEAADSSASATGTPTDEAFRIDVDRIRVGEFAAPDERRRHPKGRFYRPELYSTSEKIGSSTPVKFVVIVVLLGTAGALIALAAGSGMIL